MFQARGLVMFGPCLVFKELATCICHLCDPANCCFFFVVCGVFCFIMSIVTTYHLIYLHYLELPNTFNGAWPKLFHRFPLIYPIYNRFFPIVFFHIPLRFYQKTLLTQKKKQPQPPLWAGLSTYKWDEPANRGLTNQYHPGSSYIFPRFSHMFPPKPHPKPPHLQPPSPVVTSPGHHWGGPAPPRAPRRRRGARSTPSGRAAHPPRRWRSWAPRGHLWGGAGFGECITNSRVSSSFFYGV